MRKAILIGLCLAMLLAGCTYSGSFTRNSVENTTADTWTMAYEQFDGSKAMTVAADQDIAAEFTVAIATDSGSLSLSITGTDGTEYYRSSDLPTSEFVVRADKSGPYEIRFEADHHRGSFAVSWSSVEQTPQP